MFAWFCDCFILSSAFGMDLAKFFLTNCNNLLPLKLWEKKKTTEVEGILRNETAVGAGGWMSQEVGLQKMLWGMFGAKPWPFRLEPENQKGARDRPWGCLYQELYFWCLHECYLVELFSSWLSHLNMLENKGLWNIQTARLQVRSRLRYKFPLSLLRLLQDWQRLEHSKNP